MALAFAAVAGVLVGGAVLGEKSSKARPEQEDPLSEEQRVMLHGKPLKPMPFNEMWGRVEISRGLLQPVQSEPYFAAWDLQKFHNPVTGGEVYATVSHPRYPMFGHNEAV